MGGGWLTGASGIAFLTKGWITGVSGFDFFTKGWITGASGFVFMTKGSTLAFFGLIFFSGGCDSVTISGNVSTGGEVSCFLFLLGGSNTVISSVS